jgi:hypothetical protein
MGNFYTNITVKGVDQGTVLKFLKERRRRAYISPTTGQFTVVYDARSENQDTKVITGLAAELSRSFRCTALGVLNHDDDILWYVLYHSGKRIEEYDSRPGILGSLLAGLFSSKVLGSHLCSVFQAKQKAARVNKILKSPYIFAVRRHEDLAQALGLPDFSVGLGYNYIEQGQVEFIPKQVWNGFVKTEP